MFYQRFHLFCLGCGNDYECHKKDFKGLYEKEVFCSCGEIMSLASNDSIVAAEATLTDVDLCSPKHS